MVVEFAEKSLLGKVRSRPDLARQVIDKARREQPDLRGGRLPDQVRDGSERILPVDVVPFAGTLDPRLQQAVLAVDPFVTEPVAVRNPGLVDSVVGSRHSAHQASPTDVREKIRSHAVMG